MENLVRSEMLLGREAMERLAASHVAVFGIGGVGGFAAEALARGGVGELTLVDHDTVSESNLNRQLVALRSTLGRRKVEVMAERIADIRPETVVHALPLFWTVERAADMDFADFDYVVDAIDTVTSKIALIAVAQEAGTPIISAMGAGNKLDPARFQVGDLFQTAGCPLARVMRRELRARGIDALQVVWSPEQPVKPTTCEEEYDDGPARRAVPGSVSFVPPVAGMLAAGAVIRALAGM